MELIQKNYLNFRTPGVIYPMKMLDILLFEQYQGTVWFKIWVFNQDFSPLKNK